MLPLCIRSSSVAGRLEPPPPPIGLWSMQNCTFFGFWGRFLVKNWKQPPAKKIGSRSCEEHVVIRSEKALEFRMLAGKSVSISLKTFLETTCFWSEKTFESPNLAGKSVSISVKTFLETTCFWSEKTFESPNLAGKSVSISVKTFLETTCFWSEKTFELPSFPRTFGQTVWFWFKGNEIRVKVVCTFLTLSKKPPPFPNSGYAPD